MRSQSSHRTAQTAGPSVWATSKLVRRSMLSLSARMQERRSAKVALRNAILQCRHGAERDLSRPDANACRPAAIHGHPVLLVDALGRTVRDENRWSGPTHLRSDRRRTPHTLGCQTCSRKLPELLGVGGRCRRGRLRGIEPRHARLRRGWWAIGVGNLESIRRFSE